MVRDHFVENRPAGRAPVEGLDIGTGANLYPAMSMLPFCDTVSLVERSRPNREWLRAQRECYASFWNAYWRLLCKNSSEYAGIDLQYALKCQLQVRSGNIFRMPSRRFGIGTMFFVAESISDRESEFIQATEGFFGSLKVGAPFACAFMQESRGYTVGKIRYPAVSITKTDIEHCLADLVDDFQVTPVCSDKPLRPGYKGMILALGRAGKSRN
jgi:hypothetical protein